MPMLHPDPSPDPAPGEASPCVRPGHIADLPALQAIEQRCFAGDRFSPRVMRYLMTRAHGDFLVACEGDQVIGYATVLYRRASQVACLYSLAVDLGWQAKRVGSMLRDAAERHATRAGCACMRLEVRADNEGAIRHYLTAGYRTLGESPGYYEDGCAALKMEKLLDMRERDA